MDYSWQARILPVLPVMAKFSVRVQARSAGRPRFEALVEPVVLLGHFAHALFDECIHAPSVGVRVLRWKVVPRRIEPQYVSSPPRKLPSEHRYDRRTGEACDA